MKANIELTFMVKIGDEEVTKTVKLTGIEMCHQLFEDFCAYYNGKSCKVNMSDSAMNIDPRKQEFTKCLEPGD